MPGFTDFSTVRRELLGFDALALSLALNSWWTRFEKQVRLIRNGV
jgi:hypothetical protein